jgi:hypothetical protein
VAVGSEFDAEGNDVAAGVGASLADVDAEAKIEAVVRLGIEASPSQRQSRV